MDRPDASGDDDNTAPSTGPEEPITAHLELATLLLDEQWNEFMDLWSTRNDHTRQGERQRFNAWFEHRRLRPTEVREAEELQRTCRISAYAVCGVLSVPVSSKHGTSSLITTGDISSSLGCHSQPRGFHVGSTTLLHGNTPEALRCPWIKRMSKNRGCRQIGCRVHSSTLCTVSGAEDWRDEDEARQIGASSAPNEDLN